jgi:hypothetical protein
MTSARVRPRSRRVLRLIALERIVRGALLLGAGVYLLFVHLCACGCGHEIVTPLSPTDWRLIFDGETVSLKPSIGNWSYECQSHYWIVRDRIRWARRLTRPEIDAGRARDRRAKAGREKTVDVVPDRKAREWSSPPSPRQVQLLAEH